MRDSYFSDVRSFIRENSGILDSERLFSIIDKLENNSFFTDADSITEEGIFSLYGSVTSVSGTREIETQRGPQLVNLADPMQRSRPQCLEAPQ